jgi:UDP-glucuronate 4-epimerase
MAIAKFTDLLARGKSIPLYGTGQSRRDYTYIDDIVDGVVAAHDLAPKFEIFNLGGSQTTALLDLVHWIAGELGVEPKLERHPDQPGDVPITFADVTKAGELLGYSPKVPIREGLKRYVAWYRARRERPASR